MLSRLSPCDPRESQRCPWESGHQPAWGALGPLPAPGPRGWVCSSLPSRGCVQAGSGFAAPGAAGIPGGVAHRARFLGDTPAPKLAVAGGARGPVGPAALRPVLTELRAPVTNSLAPARLAFRVEGTRERFPCSRWAHGEPRGALRRCARLSCPDPRRLTGSVAGA